MRHTTLAARYLSGDPLLRVGQQSELADHAGRGGGGSERRRQRAGALEVLPARLREPLERATKARCSCWRLDDDYPQVGTWSNAECCEPLGGDAAVARDDHFIALASACGAHDDDDEHTDAGVGQPSQRQLLQAGCGATVRCPHERRPLGVPWGRRRATRVSLRSPAWRGSQG